MKQSTIAKAKKYSFGLVVGMIIMHFLHKKGYMRSGQILKGGIGDKTKIEDINPASLREGINVEMEHTTDINIAREIAVDHITEDPDYYVKLRAIENH